MPVKAAITISPYTVGMASTGQVQLATAAAIQVSFDASGSAQSPAIDTEVVRLIADQDVYIDIGSNPVADANKMLLPAGVIEYLAIERNSKIAARGVTTSGTLRIVPAAMH